MIERLEFLKKISYFSGIEKENLKDIAEIMIERTYRRGHILFMEGGVRGSRPLCHGGKGEDL